MNRLYIKPLSVNKCFQGRRFRTKEYDYFEKDVMMLLPKIDIPKGRLLLRLKFGFSSKASDIDNGVKPLLDILQKAYGFNDKMIFCLLVIKEIVPKKEEFIEFELSTYK